MTIAQVKSEIASKLDVVVNQLTMQQQKDEQDVLIPWVSSWDNDHRIRVSMHLDVFNSIKANPKLDTLSLKYEEIPATQERESYHKFMVITPTNVLGSF